MRGLSSLRQLGVAYGIPIENQSGSVVTLALHSPLQRSRNIAFTRHFSSGDDDNKGNPVGRMLKFLTGQDTDKDAKSTSDSGKASSSETSSSSAELVPSNPETRYREVLAVPLPRRPLFPGGIMPVTVHNPALIQELATLKRQGGQAYVGAFLRKTDTQLPSEPPFGPTSSDDLLASSLESGLSDVDLIGQDGFKLLHPIGTFAQVHTIAPHEKGAQLLLLGHRRIRATGVAADSPLRLSVMHLRDEPYEAGDDTLKATTMEIISTLKELLHMHPLYNEQMRNFIQFGADFHDLSRLADLSASLTSADARALQDILEELSVPERAGQALLLLKKEAELCKLQADIGRRVEEKISKDQRRYLLMEQLKSIKKELGLEKDEKTALIQKFRERLEPVEDSLPEEAKKVIEEELEKLSAIEPASSEFNITRNYLDWLTSLPWGQSSEELLDVVEARRVLDEDHYGLDDVKQRILEFIAVGKLKGNTQGKVLMLVGPPGVGKTSIGHSIARALNRKFYRFSVGGLSDVAEIKGHRRTYVGAMPGKAVQCLKATGVSNPLVLIDEIDKLGRGYQGDPASALLELLDPEQNKNFLDHYLDVPVDLSRVLFVCTANVLDTVPGPLLDRMEVIRLSGYIFDEKIAIAKTYLEPQCREASGVPKDALTITDAAMRVLVDDYAREAGVRNLKNQLEKIYRKAALKLVQGGLVLDDGGGDVVDKKTKKEEKGKEGKEELQIEDGDGDGKENQAINIDTVLESEDTAADDDEKATPTTTTTTTSTTEPPNTSIATEEEEQKQKQELPYTGPVLTVDVADLKEYLGQPPYPSDKIYRDHTPAGVVTGLAWTALGGSTLYIEAASIESGEGKGSLRATGQLGDVMKESTTIAHTFARRFLETVDPEKKDYFSQHALHVHVPAGATPKDGPSAGCTVVTALLSLALDKPVRSDLAMTGEVTLTGKVLPIGGVKEKALAAKRSGISLIIFPEGNKRDWEELSNEVKEGLEPHFVEDYEEIYKLAFE